jgi:menaquinone-dependent protoporphyrinogen oxidase
MRVLVVVASRHGSTNLIADCLREELDAAGCQADLLDVEAAPGIAEYDAVVLGSAVYGGHWLKPARKFAERYEAGLRGKPVWLFSSGPVGEPARPDDPPVDAVEWLRRLGARGHEVFAGRLERAQLGWGERLRARAIDAPDGDYRSWLAIGRWARSIAAELRQTTASPAEVPLAV